MAEIKGIEPVCRRCGWENGPESFNGQNTPSYLGVTCKYCGSEFYVSALGNDGGKNLLELTDAEEAGLVSEIKSLLSFLDSLAGTPTRTPRTRWLREILRAIESPLD